jgi:large subunit ribosomal protein L15
MNITDVHQGAAKRKPKKRVGRGVGSGHGRTCGRGDKGHSAHPGFSRRFAFEGCQKQLMRRVAKSGFSNNFYAAKVAIVNIADLEGAFDAGATVDPAALEAAGLVKGRYDAIKILGDGSLTRKLSVEAHQFSRSAADKITAAGGTVERIPG